MSSHVVSCSAETGCIRDSTKSLAGWTRRMARTVRFACTQSVFSSARGSKWLVSFPLHPRMISLASNVGKTVCQFQRDCPIPSIFEFFITELRHTVKLLEDNPQRIITTRALRRGWLRKTRVCPAKNSAPSGQYAAQANRAWHRLRWVRCRLVLVAQ